MEWAGRLEEVETYQVRFSAGLATATVLTFEAQLACEMQLGIETQLICECSQTDATGCMLKSWRDRTTSFMAPCSLSC